MSASSMCVCCLRTLRQQNRQNLTAIGKIRQPLQHLGSSSHSHNTRALSTSLRKLAAQPSSNSSSKTPPPPPPRPRDTNSLAQFAASIRNTDSLRSTTEPYIAYGSTEDLFRECAKQCDYTIPTVLKEPPEPPPRTAEGEDLGEGSGWWYARKDSGGLGLDVTFNAWAQVMMLHMWLLTVRLRRFPAKHARIWHQNLLDHFFYAAEDRMAMWHGMSARGVRNRYLKDLWQQWRGLILSYDEGLVKGDAVLATAVWRNVFKAADDVDVGDLALVTAYMRQQLQMLDVMSDEKFGTGDIAFGDPKAARILLEQRSAEMQGKSSAKGEIKV